MPLAVSTLIVGGLVFRGIQEESLVDSSVSFIRSCQALTTHPFDFPCLLIFCPTIACCLTGYHSCYAGQCVPSPTVGDYITPPDDIPPDDTETEVVIEVDTSKKSGFDGWSLAGKVGLIVGIVASFITILGIWYKKLT